MDFDPILSEDLLLVDRELMSMGRFVIVIDAKWIESWKQDIIVICGDLLTVSSLMLFDIWCVLFFTGCLRVKWFLIFYIFFLYCVQSKQQQLPTQKAEMKKKFSMNAAVWIYVRFQLVLGIKAILFQWCDCPMGINRLKLWCFSVFAPLNSHTQTRITINVGYSNSNGDTADQADTLQNIFNHISKQLKWELFWYCSALRFVFTFCRLLFYCQKRNRKKTEWIIEWKRIEKCQHTQFSNRPPNK